MVPASGDISNRMVVIRGTLCVPGVHDLPGHEVSHELPDVPGAMVPALSALGNFLPDTVVEVSAFDQTSHNEIDPSGICSS